jgi:hypothetical protein
MDRVNLENCFDFQDQSFLHDNVQLIMAFEGSILINSRQLPLAGKGQTRLRQLIAKAVGLNRFAVIL